MKRSAGILLPLSSLPSPYGIGCFDQAAYGFVDWLSDAGQRFWQVLPLCPTSFGDSPYQSFSAFAGNPYFISLRALIEEGLLCEEECASADLLEQNDLVDYEKQYLHRFPLLRLAYGRWKGANDSDFLRFCDSSPWLEDYSLFMAVKDDHDGAPWFSWEKPLRLHEQSAIEKAQSDLADAIGFYRFLQYYFFKQWHSLKAYANEKGIRMIGDIPIYAALDSVDVWVHPELFQLGDDRVPIAVAGCPPDGFSEDGQLWGNPLYDWSAHEATGYAWWIERMRQCFSLYDTVRIDHFRGFDAYFSIPYGEETARNGHWENGPGMRLFDAVKAALGEKEVIAEDLGFMTDSVKALVRQCGYPNMKVLQFAFDARDEGGEGDHLPHNYPENCVAYTGTHDNQTTVSWFQTISEEERSLTREYLCNTGVNDESITVPLIALLMRSSARYCVIPMQDWLGLDDTARMNIPSTLGGNWTWRLDSKMLNDALSAKIRRMTRLYGRE